jgi:hypothetical protein
MRQTKLFHFKVLELQQYHDNVVLSENYRETETNLYQELNKSNKMASLSGNLKPKILPLVENYEMYGSKCFVKYHFLHRLISRYYLDNRDEEGKIID